MYLHGPECCAGITALTQFSTTACQGRARQSLSRLGWTLLPILLHRHARVLHGIAQHHRFSRRDHVPAPVRNRPAVSLSSSVLQEKKVVRLVFDHVGNKRLAFVASL